MDIVVHAFNSFAIRRQTQVDLHEWGQPGLSIEWVPGQTPEKPSWTPAPKMKKCSPDWSWNHEITCLFLPVLIKCLSHHLPKLSLHVCTSCLSLVSVTTWAISLTLLFNSNVLPMKRTSFYFQIRNVFKFLIIKDVVDPRSTEYCTGMKFTYSLTQVGAVPFLTWAQTLHFCSLPIYINHLHISGTK